MRALTFAAFLVAAAAIGGCRADYLPRSTSVARETAPMTPPTQDHMAAAAELPADPGEPTGPPVNILKPPL